MMKSNKEVHMVEDEGVNPLMYTIVESDVFYFLNALRGNVTYDVSDSRINKMENFLIHWLNGFWFENKYEVIVWMYTHGISEYAFEDEVYRGIDLKDGRNLEFGHYASFSSQQWVAEEFVEYASEGYTRYMFRSDDVTFDFSAMLRDVVRLTTNGLLLGEIEERVYEEEKIGYFDDRCVDISAGFGFR